MQSFNSKDQLENFIIKHKTKESNNYKSYAFCIVNRNTIFELRKEFIEI
ncbi:hypothetical protein ECHHL_0537 [Ehrlichia chaffeensis str. Heartland]|uniref:Conserved domain protein n=1 Tax=Ehrlichia chaffeensis (strain ATCC CRL-10679 / Arkansas) TaxID=205920 RepID=Q2GGL0_EHRCR|nr:conserved domain protein [Ehrlichia chaffeensis str. Arkansas]AHX03694.1 hypothetical protein ECHHL_0537 [Ehrlichia chaffeensis str. Heartland]AHX05585.1 hypothetical protein ECHJAX_0520 [Ehrlichia chaffeensis str. Jax]AHX07079.1 hypothetical protein ECHOSC_0545 [Ehrlichia chaffeensis str. Osceola]AHX08353.1 hypothetical protein ECHSTV_0509 [Ehrlichia chaffeensis str. Saint Vincent]AHX09691.1 hypothetical protein ECHWAK_0515 [Ehrlichia chaffeensis str. Wakulla]AHX10390.1 hypothetical prote